MDKFIIQGDNPLQGEIPISGSKNAAMPVMAAALLADSPTVIHAVPRLKDIYTFNNVLRITGAHVDFDEENHTLTIDPSHVTHLEAPYELVRKMRASFYMLGALLGRYGRAKVSLPGGCAWGPRPVDLHLKGLRTFGAEIELDNGYVLGNAPDGKLNGGTFRLEPSSVGATINLLLATVRSQGMFTIENAAREPDVVQLCSVLEQMGGHIEGVGTKTLTIEGVDTLEGVEVQNDPDRIETGTFMIAGAMHPDSEITLTQTRPEDLGDFLNIFKQLNAETRVEVDRIHVSAPSTLEPLSIETAVYPGFPTDLQAQWSTMMTQADGTSTVTDHIYNDRFNHVPELVRLGASIHVKGNTAHIHGKTPLQGASVMSTDLRASVSLVLGGMIAKGETEVRRIYHLDRGYENLEEKLNNVGAQIRRVPDEDQP